MHRMKSPVESPQYSSDPEVWDYKQAAKFLGITVGHLQILVFRLQVPHYRYSKRVVKFDPAELHQWRESRRVKVAS